MTNEWGQARVGRRAHEQAHDALGRGDVNVLGDVVGGLRDDDGGGHGRARTE